MNNDDFMFSALERQAFGRIAMQNEEARIKRDMDARDRVEKENKFRDAIVEENREAMREAAEKEREQMFMAEAELKFFEANPNASAEDFKRIFPKLRDEFLLGNFREAMQNDKPQFWEAEFN